MTLPPPIDWRAAGLGNDPGLPDERRVTGENWRTWPYSRWAFQHTRELVPSRPLPGTSPRRLETAPAKIDDIAFDGPDGGTMTWRNFVERTYADGVIVIHRGRVVYETYLNGMTPATPHHLFSVTKSIVGLVAEALIGERRIDDTVRVADAVPELGDSAFADATLRQLLDMTDGVAFDEDYANLDSDVHRYSASYWTPSVATGGTLPALKRLTQREAAPGSAFRYRTPVADAAAWVLRRVTGATLTDLVAEHVWGPAGCGDAAHFLLDTGGNEIAGSGLNATLRDMARLALWLLEGGSDAFARIRKGGDRALFAANPRTARPGFSYRSLWWIDHGVPAAAAMGVFGQRLYIEPESGLALVRVGSHPVASNIETDALHARAIAALRAALG